MAIIQTRTRVKSIDLAVKLNKDKLLKIKYSLFVERPCFANLFNMENEFGDTVISLYDSNKWESILNLNVNPLNDMVHSLLWVWPSKDNLLFIKEIVTKLNLKGITSIGCGSGLFEWLLEQCTGIPVTGIEIDESWWSSKYAKYKFIPLKFTKMPPNENCLPKNYALLFCYFNNGPAFQEYIQYYKGSLVFIVGPGPGRGTLTNPAPFTADFGSSEWYLLDKQEVKDTKDFIAAYARKQSSPSPIDR